MKKKDKEAWLAALRSGEYKQTKGALCRGDDEKARYCCLGVAYDTLVDGEWVKRTQHGIKQEWSIKLPSGKTSQHGFLPRHIRKKLGITDRDMKHLAQMNDFGSTFSTIANWIEKNIDPK